jgi:LysR family glycine cleavage system transcriptional activator
LNAALGNIKTRRTEAEIAVSLLPVMAARWLVPRLPVSPRPAIRTSITHIRLTVAGQFQIDGVDIAIRFDGRLEGPAGDQALDEELSGVRPSLNDGRLPKDPHRCYRSRC